MLEQYKELDRRGYEIRMEDPEINYRISLKGQNLSLFIKKQNEKKFQEVEFNWNDDVFVMNAEFE